MELNKKQRGQRIRATEYNEIVDRLNAGWQEQPSGRGYASTKGGAFGAVNASRNRFPINVIASEEIPAYSIFSFKHGQEPESPPKLNAAKIGEDGAPWIFLTNDSIEIPADSQASCRAIGNYDITKLQVVEGDEHKPKVGQTCGPHFGTYAISVKGAGLVCIVEPDDDGIATVMRIDADTLAVDLQEDIDGRAGSTIHSGNARIVNRDGTTAQYIDSPWGGVATIEVWNISETDYSSGERVLVTNCAGIGYVIIQGRGGEPGSSGQECAGLTGQNAPEVDSDPDYILGWKDGCVILVPVYDCEEGDPSSSSSSSGG